MLKNPTSEDAIKGSSDRVFGLMFAAIFTGISLWPLLHEMQIRFWALAAGSVFLVLALAWPRALSWLNRAWMRFGLLLNCIVSPLAIGVVYYFALVPMAMLMRMLGKQPLKLKRDAEAISYWIPRKPPGPDPKTMSDQF